MGRQLAIAEMLEFRFEAIDRDGKPAAGTMVSGGEAEAVAALAARGLTPLRVVPATEGARRSEGGRAAVPGKATHLILRELAVLLRSGLTVPRALTVVRKLVAPRLARQVERMIAAVRGGSRLADALAEAPALFPAPVRGAVAAGEASGHLVDVLDQLVEGIGRDLETRRRLLSILAYPLILLLVMAGTMAVIFGVVLPSMEPLFLSAGVHLPWATLVVIGLAHGIRDWGELVAGGLVALLFGLLLLLRSPAWRHRLDRWSLREGVLFGLPRRIAAARFCHLAGALLAGGLTLDRALEAAAEASANSRLAEILRQAVVNVRRGAGLAPQLAAGDALPAVVLEMAAVGEETARLGPMLREAAAALDAETATAMDRVALVLPPALTLLMGLAVAGLMAGVVGGLLAANEIALSP